MDAHSTEKSCVRVSIPYLRVTHWYEIYGDGPTEKFQSPIYGSRTCYITLYCIHSLQFQSPIYGSRTIKRQNIECKEQEFQSPIYGSRTGNRKPCNSCPMKFQSPIYGSRTLPWDGRLYHFARFNPLSTGHAPGSKTR